MKDNLREFEKLYHAEVDVSRKRYYSKVDDYYTIGQTYPVEVKTEFGLEITMSKENFERLLYDLESVRILQDKVYYLDELASIKANTLRKEEELRETYPTLKKAHDKYLMVLDMVSGRKNGKNS